MITPHRSTSASADQSIPLESKNMVLNLQFSGRTAVVTHDGFTIGSSHQCDLRLDESSLAGLHCRIHMQSGAIWIEVAADDLFLTINNRQYRRMALRHEDRVKIGSVEITFLMTNEAVPVADEAPLAEDLSLLTAEELCDRILSEQAMVDEFVEGQRSGWEALLKAIQSAQKEPSVNTASAEKLQAPVDGHVPFGTLLEQIQELNESVKGHTRELGVHEKEVFKTTSIMEESQHRAVQQLDEILEKLKSSEPISGLRASA